MEDGVDLLGEHRLHGPLAGEGGALPCGPLAHELHAEHGSDPSVELREVSCIGRCDRAPAVSTDTELRRILGPDPVAPGAANRGRLGVGAQQDPPTPEPSGLGNVEMPSYCAGKGVNDCAAGLRGRNSPGMPDHIRDFREKARLVDRVNDHLDGCDAGQQAEQGRAAFPRPG